MKKSLTVFGACVSTDTFLHAINDNKMDFLIKNTAYQISPVTAIEKIPADFLMDFSPKGRFERTNSSFLSDVRKDFFNSCRLRKTDYLVIDFVATYFPILQIFDAVNDDVMVLTHGIEIKNHIEVDLYAFLQEKGLKYKLIPAIEYYELYRDIDSVINEFASICKEIWGQERIIVIHTISCKKFFTRKGTVGNVNISKQNDDIIEKCFKKFVELCPKVHVIEPLDNMVSSFDSMWGVGPFHAHKLYYQYVYDCVDKITDEYDRNIEDKEVAQLREHYSSLLNEKLMQAYDTTVEKYERLFIESSFFINQHDNSRIILGNSYIQNELRQAKSLNEYVDKLCKEKNQGLLMFLSVRDSANKYWADFVTRGLLGIRTDVKFHMSYIAIVDIDQCECYEAYNEKAEKVSYHFEMVLKDNNYLTNQMEKYFVFDLFSKGRSLDKENNEIFQYSHIYINNVDYSMNQRGVNIVVFSKKEHAVIDSVNVDLWGDCNLMVKRN